MYTFAELFLMAVLGAGLYFCLSPVTRRLENFFTRFFDDGKPKRDRVVIDIDRKNKDS